MNILLLNSTYSPTVIGGAELSVQYLAESLVKLKHNVTVVCAAEESGQSRINGVSVYYLKLRNLYWPYGRRKSAPARLAWNLLDIQNPWMADQLGKVLDVTLPDLVHTNNLQGWSVSVWSAAAKRKIPIVHTLRDLFLICPRSTMFHNGSNCSRVCGSCELFSRAKRHAHTTVDHVVGISKFILDRHRENGWFCGTPSSVIHNSFQPLLKEVSQRVDGKVRFGFLGRIDQRKGIELLIQSIRELGDKQQVELFIGGEGDPEYVHQIKASLPGNATMLGRVSQDQFFPQVDIVVVPSIINEALGRVVLEAYAYGKPVIGSNRGGIPEIIRHGKTGLLFDPSKPSNLTAALKRFLEAPALQQQMSPSCYREFERFRPNVIASQYLDVYRSMVVSTSPVHGLGEVSI